MRDALRWISYLCIALITAVIIAFIAYRLRGPSHAQREALVQMKKDYRPHAGRNAFPLVWFMRYDVPESDLDARMAADVAAAGKRMPAGVFQMEPTATKLAEATADISRLCSRRAEGCLAKASTDSESMRAALAQFPTIRAREKAFAAVDFYWDDFPTDYRLLALADPTPALQIWLSDFALEYAEGDRAGALSKTCGNVGAWRRVHGGTNSRVGAMIAAAAAEAGIRLFAEMLAALPESEQVPDVCGIALRPVDGADVDQCARVGQRAGAMGQLDSRF